MREPTIQRTSLLQVRVVDQRAAVKMATATVAATNRGTVESVQIPDHNGCPPPAQYQTIGAAILGAIGTMTAWFKEDLFGARSRGQKDLEARLSKLEEAHNLEENEKLISKKVEEQLALALKQRATETH